MSNPFQKALLNELMALVITGWQLQKKIPSRTGGYLISMPDFYESHGVERVSAKRFAADEEFIYRIMGDACETIRYDTEDRAYHFNFNDRISVEGDFLYIGDGRGSAVAHRIPPEVKARVSLH